MSLFCASESRTWTNCPRAPFSSRSGLCWFRPPSRLFRRQVNLESQSTSTRSYSELTHICRARPVALRVNERLRFNRFQERWSVSLLHFKLDFKDLGNIYLHAERSRLLSTMLRKYDRLLALPSSSFSGSLLRPPCSGHVDHPEAVPDLWGSNPTIRGAFTIVRKRR